MSQFSIYPFGYMLLHISDLVTQTLSFDLRLTRQLPQFLLNLFLLALSQNIPVANSLPLSGLCKLLKWIHFQSILVQKHLFVPILLGMFNRFQDVSSCFEVIPQRTVFEIELHVLHVFVEIEILVQFHVHRFLVGQHSEVLVVDDVVFLSCSHSPDGGGEKQQEAGPKKSSPPSNSEIVCCELHSHDPGEYQSSSYVVLHQIFTKQFKDRNLVIHLFVIDSIEVLMMLELLQQILFSLQFLQMPVQFFISCIFFIEVLGSEGLVIYLNFFCGTVLTAGVEVGRVQ